MKKLITTLIAALFLFANIPAYAASAQESQSTTPVQYGVLYTEFLLVSAALSISSGTATCTGNARTLSDRTITIDMQLLKYQNGGWLLVDSWSGSGVSSLTLSRTKTGLASGYQYKVMVTARAWDGGTLLETVTKSSSTVTY